MGTAIFLGVKRPERGATTHFLLVPDREWVGDMLPSLLCACIGMSWGDFLLLVLYKCYESQNIYTYIYIYVYILRYVS